MGREIQQGRTTAGTERHERKSRASVSRYLVYFRSLAGDVCSTPWINARPPCFGAGFCSSDRLVKDENGQMKGATVQDTITKETWEVAAKSVINATGCFCDAIRCAAPLLLVRRLFLAKSVATLLLLYCCDLDPLHT